MTVANGRLDGLPALAAVSRAVRLATLPNILLVACVVVAVWLVFVPLSALLYNAFTEDTGFRSRRVLPRQFRRGLFELAYPATVLEFPGVRPRHGGDHLRHGRAGGLGGRAHRRPRRDALSHAVAVVVRRSRIADGHGLDFRVQPQYRLGQCGAEIGVRAGRGAGQHLLDGGNDLGAVEPLFSARLSGARAGAARARRAHGGGRA